MSVTSLTSKVLLENGAVYEIVGKAFDGTGVYTTGRCVSYPLGVDHVPQIVWSYARSGPTTLEDYDCGNHLMSKGFNITAILPFTWVPPDEKQMPRFDKYIFGAVTPENAPATHSELLLGHRPRELWVKERKKEILEAIYRYNESEQMIKYLMSEYLALK